MRRGAMAIQQARFPDRGKMVMSSSLFHASRVLSKYHPEPAGEQTDNAF
jgi:hypothetical protein